MGAAVPFLCFNVFCGGEKFGAANPSLLALGPLVLKFARRGGPWTPRAPPGSSLEKTSNLEEKPSTWPSHLDRPAPLMSRGISAAHHRRWAAYAMSLGLGFRDLGFRFQHLKSKHSLKNSFSKHQKNTHPPIGSPNITKIFHSQYTLVSQLYTTPTTHKPPSTLLLGRLNYARVALLIGG